MKSCTREDRENNDEAERIEGKIALNEARVALRNMKHYKSPGTDGFST